jgi:RNA polymerase sigma-70 factor, ECF subfamily
VNSPSANQAGHFSDALVALMPRLRRFCLSLAGSADAGDDLMQGVLERALAKQHLYQPGTRLDHWLLRLARNLNIDRIRAEKSRGGPGESLDLAENIAGSDGVMVVEARSDLAQAGQAFLALPDTHREVFALVVLDGLSYREAAEVLEVPIGTVMSRIARARIMLERAVGGNDADG